MSLAVATRIPVQAWLREPAEVILTAFQILDDQADQVEAARGR